MTFPKKAPGETKLLTFDFTGDAAPSAALANPAVIAVVATGYGDPSDVDIDTTIQVDGQKILVLVGGGIDRTTYRMRGEADADNGEHHIIEKDLPVSDDAALVQ